ncbi:hypothetical protein CQ12_10575 [Bradyrhizobium jicamae]|uniref:Uncharacterized protein n=1 Tax=Bradyrhizobium jicamae TaxID=280332 RepID=A0A0R3LR95_9BRAD|nr:hypothetical protein CQ12_10575 [Bradyrhizobium jicamae]
MIATLDEDFTREPSRSSAAAKALASAAKCFADCAWRGRDHALRDASVAGELLGGEEHNIIYDGEHIHWYHQWRSFWFPQQQRYRIQQQRQAHGVGAHTWAVRF